EPEPPRLDVLLQVTNLVNRPRKQQFCESNHLCRKIYVCPCGRRTHLWLWQPPFRIYPASSIVLMCTETCQSAVWWSTQSGAAKPAWSATGPLPRPQDRAPVALPRTNSLLRTISPSRKSTGER